MLLQSAGARVDEGSICYGYYIKLNPRFYYYAIFFYYIFFTHAFNFLYWRSWRILYKKLEKGLRWKFEIRAMHGARDLHTKSDSIYYCLACFRKNFFLILIFRKTLYFLASRSVPVSSAFVFRYASVVIPWTINRVLSLEGCHIFHHITLVLTIEVLLYF